MDLWKWVTDNWQFVVGTILALLGLALGVWALLQRRHKRLDYEVMSDLRLIHPHAKSLKLQVMYNKELIEDPRVVVVRIRNTGRKAITQDDFKVGEPITIRYSKNWYSGAVATRTSPGVGKTGIASVDRIAEPSDEYPNNEIVAITPRLLNPGEWFDVQLVSDGPHGDIKVASRFADQSRPMRPAEHSRRLTRRLLWAVFGALSILMVVFLVRLTQVMSSPAIEAEIDRQVGPETMVFGWILLGAATIVGAAVMFRTVKDDNPNVDP